MLCTALLLSIGPVLPALQSAPLAPRGREMQRIARPIGAYSAASAGDRIEVLTLRDFPADRLCLFRSDGRALRWDQRVVRRAPTFSLTLFEDSYAIRGAESYVVWTESLASPTSEVEALFMASRDGGETFSEPLLLDKGSPANVGSVRGLAMALAEEPAGPVIHVLLAATDDQPAFSGDGDLYLVSSRDGGRSFSAALEVTDPAARAADVGAIALGTEGSRVYVAWVDDREGERHVYARRSLDGGRTWAGPESRLSGAVPALPRDDQRLRLLHRADDLVVAWVREEGFFVYSVRAAASNDGGASFRAAGQVGGYTPGVHHAYLGDGAADDRRFFLTWSDRRSGSAQVYVANSTDGLVWNEVAAYEPAPLAGPLPRLCAADGLVGLVAQETNGVYAALVSLDGGTTWSAPVRMGMPEVSRLEPRVVFNRLYRNLAAFWTLAPAGGSNELFTSGFRPQTLDPGGFTGGGPASFALSGFSGAFPQVFVLASDAPGSFALTGEDRDLGLRPGPLFGTTIHGVDGFDAVLDPLGRGVTAPRPFPALSGLSLWLVAVAFDPERSTFGAITDVVELRFP